MPLTPEDVQKKQFTTVRFKEGYDEEEVDAFLDEVEAELRRLLAENQQLNRTAAAPAAPAAAPPPQAPPPPAAPGVAPPPVAPPPVVPPSPPVTAAPPRPASSPPSSPFAPAPPLVEDVDPGSDTPGRTPRPAADDTDVD